MSVFLSNSQNSCSQKESLIGWQNLNNQPAGFWVWAGDRLKRLSGTVCKGVHKELEEVSGENAVSLIIADVSGAKVSII